MPPIPEAQSAIIEIEKLSSYALDESHVEGKHKARVFKSALGLTRIDAHWFREEILRILPGCEAQMGKSSAFGDRYNVDMEIVLGDKRAMLRTAWIIRKGELAPRMTTCYIL